MIEKSTLVTACESSLIQLKGLLQGVLEPDVVFSYSKPEMLACWIMAAHFAIKVEHYDFKIQ